MQAHNSAGWSSISNTLYFQTKLANVSLTLYVHEGGAVGPVIVGAQVNGNDADGNSFYKTTNSSGYVTITGVPGTWNFAVSKSDYHSNSWSQSITTDSTKHAYLVKVIQKPDPPVPISPGTSSSPGVVVESLTPTLQWSASSGADYYALAISKYPYGSSNIVYNPQQIYGNSHTVPGGILEPGQKYRWNMQAHNSAGWSNISNTLYFQTTTPPEETSSVLIAYVEAKTEESGGWFHWGTLGTDLFELKLDLRGTESQNRSEVTIVRYEWDFGDGRTAQGEYTTHTYTTGNYNIILTVYDEAGNSASETLRIEVRGASASPTGSSISDPRGDVDFDFIDILRVTVTQTGETLIGEIELANLPHELVFNQAPVDRLEYYWDIVIDLDGNPDTGPPVYDGAEYMLHVAHFVPPDSEVEVKSLIDGCQINVWRYEGNNSWKWDSSAMADVDYSTNTLTIQGVIPGINNQSRWFAQASYWDPEVGNSQKDTTQSLYFGSSVSPEPSFEPHQWPKFQYDTENTGRHPNPIILNPVINWTFKTGNYIRSSPVIAADGTIYIGSQDKKLYAINPNGTLKWIYTTWGQINAGAPSKAKDGTIYVGSINMDEYIGKLYAINPDGTLKWEYDVGKASFDSLSPAIGRDGTIYAGGDGLFALNPDGTLKWSFTTGLIDTTPAISSNGTIYVSSRDARLYAISPNGNLKWTYTTGAQSPYDLSPPAIGLDNTIYVGTTGDNKLYAINPNGTLKWSFSPWSIVGSSASIASDGTLYFASFGRLYALQPDRSLKWEQLIGSVHGSSPAISANGTIYIGSYDGNLYALSEAIPPTTQEAIPPTTQEATPPTTQEATSQTTQEATPQTTLINLINELAIGGVPVTVNGEDYIILTLENRIDPINLEVVPDSGHTIVYVYGDRNEPISDPDIAQQIGLIDRARDFQRSEGSSENIVQQIQLLNMRWDTHQAIEYEDAIEEIIGGISLDGAVRTLIRYQVWNPIGEVREYIYRDLSMAYDQYLSALKIIKGGDLTDYQKTHDYMVDYWLAKAREDVAFSFLDEIDEIVTSKLKIIIEKIKEGAISLIPVLGEAVTLGPLGIEAEDVSEWILEYSALRDKRFLEVQPQFTPNMTQAVDYTLKLAQSPRITIEVHSPVELRVLDSEKRVTGVINGEEMNEIPYSIYYDNSVIIYYPSDLYYYEVAGTDEGLYDLIVTNIDNEIDTFKIENEPVSAETLHQYTIDWQALSEGKKGVTMKIDSDGDGVFEEIRKLGSDSEGFSWIWIVIAGVSGLFCVLAGAYIIHWRKTRQRVT